MAMNTCDVCGEYKQVHKSQDGKRQCALCLSFYKKYESHQFVKSLAYKKPSLMALGKHKPLPGQRGLFDRSPLEG
jgi:hypothetical protein